MAEKILIVDDDLETLRLVGLMLQRQGYDIAAASNGPQALGLARTEHPDLIILDVMMPDMDGIEVARKLRSDPDTAATPIIMFTAKGQVDDKVTGYEAGVDDYLTKPTHPAELVAHIKAILARAVKARPSPSVKGPEQGYIIGAVSVKGGVGVSTLVINLGISMRQKSKSDVAVVELRPGQGTWGLELGHQSPKSLNNLLNRKLNEINTTVVESELVSHASGVRLLMSGYEPDDIHLAVEMDKLMAVLTNLQMISRYILLDIGTAMFLENDKLLSLCNEIMIVVDPIPNTIIRTKTLMAKLGELEFGRSKPITVALVNRVRADTQMTLNQVQDTLAYPVSQIFTPMPELAYQAAVRMMPIVSFQPDGSASQQFSKLADLVLQHST